MHMSDQIGNQVQHQVGGQDWEPAADVSSEGGALPDPAGAAQVADLKARRLRTEEQVPRLDVPVGDGEGVQVSKSRSKLGSVLGDLRTGPTLPSARQLSQRVVHRRRLRVEQQVQGGSLTGLGIAEEEEPERDDVGVVQLLQDPKLSALPLLHSHRLHRKPCQPTAGPLAITVHGTHTLQSDQLDNSKTAFSYHALPLEGQPHRLHLLGLGHPLGKHLGHQSAPGALLLLHHPHQTT